MEERNESLIAMFPPVNATWGTGNFPTTWDADNGYVSLGTDGLVFSTNIDLSGSTRINDFTFGTAQTQYQDPGVYSSTAVSARTEVVEIISDVPLNNAALITIKDNLGVTVPGMMNSQQDFTTILYGNYRLYVPNNSLGAFPGFLQLISSGSFGSKEPSASDRLYCYRILKCVGLAGETLLAPACRVGLFGSMYAEGQLPHMMRLKRSYELQQKVD